MPRSVCPFQEIFWGNFWANFLSYWIAALQDYSELINAVSNFSCPRSMAEEARVPSMCLVCGAVVCSQSYCCQASSVPQSHIVFQRGFQERNFCHTKTELLLKTSQKWEQSDQSDCLICLAYEVWPIWLFALLSLWMFLVASWALSFYLVPSVISICVSLLQFAVAVEHSEKCTISSQFSLKSSILRCSRSVTNVLQRSLL